MDQPLPPIPPIILQTPVIEPAPIVVKKPFPKWPIYILIFLFGIASVFAYQKLTSGSDPEVNTLPVVSSPSVTTVLPSPSADPTASWQQYSLKNIALSFKLPPSLSNLGQFDEFIIPGQKGTMLCVVFSLNKSKDCGIIAFGLGTTSVNFEEGRGGTFSDLQGYQIEQGQYLAKFVQGKTFTIPSNLVKEITNKNGLTIIRVTGQNYNTGEYRGPIEGTPGDGWIGAILNIPNNLSYTGVTVQMKLDNNLSQNLFDLILSTFKFID